MAAILLCALLDADSGQTTQHLMNRRPRDLLNHDRGGSSAVPLYPLNPSDVSTPLHHHDRLGRPLRPTVLTVITIPLVVCALQLESTSNINKYVAHDGQTARRMCAGGGHAMLPLCPLGISGEATDHWKRYTAGSRNLPHKTSQKRPAKPYVERSSRSICAKVGFRRAGLHQTTVRCKGPVGR